MTDVTRFWACYILTSLKEGCHDHTYIGFTVNPKRRLRQHNGEIKNGAFRTSKKRPWEMILVVYGFPTKKEALAFEWNWQKPFASKLLRLPAKSLSGQRLGNQWKFRFKIRILFEMLTISPWNRFPLTVQWLTSKTPLNMPSIFPQLPTPPSHMKQIYAPVSQLDLLLQENVNDDQEGIESGEEDHSSDEDDLILVEAPSSTLQRSSSVLETSLLQNQRRFSESSGKMDEDMEKQTWQEDQTSLSQMDHLPTGSDKSHSSNNTISNGLLGAARRRSLSANALTRLTSAEVVDEAHLFHTTQLDEDDDSFLHVPAFSSTNSHRAQANMAPPVTGTNSISPATLELISISPMAPLSAVESSAIRAITKAESIGTKSTAAIGALPSSSSSSTRFSQTSSFRHEVAHATRVSNSNMIHSSNIPTQMNESDAFSSYEPIEPTRTSSDIKCDICQLLILKVEHGLTCSKESCSALFHIVCLANKAIQAEKQSSSAAATVINSIQSLIPTTALCPSCGNSHRWMDLIRYKQRTLTNGSNPLIRLK